MPRKPKYGYARDIFGRVQERDRYKEDSTEKHIGLGYTYDNQSELENRGEFFMHGDLSRTGSDITLDVNILPSMLYLNSREWRIQPSHMKIAPDGVDVSSVQVLSGEQSVSLTDRKSVV